MPQPDPCRQLRVPECLVKADSSGCGTEESHTVKGASSVHGICVQVLTVWDITFTFLPRAAQENEVLKFPDLREGDAVLDSGAECAHTHMMQYVEVCELLAGAQETYYIMKQLAIAVGNFCDKHNEYGGKFFLQSSTTSRSALRTSQVYQPITSFLP